MSLKDINVRDLFRGNNSNRNKVFNDNIATMLMMYGEVQDDHIVVPFGRPREGEYSLNHESIEEGVAFRPPTILPSLASQNIDAIHSNRYLIFSNLKSDVTREKLVFVLDLSKYVLLSTKNPQVLTWHNEISLGMRLIN